MLTLIPIALISGFLTVFSPCVLPILPIVLASGTDGKKSRVNGVIIGLVFSFTVTALFLTAIVTSVGFSADTLRNIAAVMLALFGVSLIFPIWDKIQAKIEPLFNIQVKQNRSGFFGGFLTGISLGVVWTPCVGPIVTSVATLALSGTVSVFNLLVVLSYAVGIAVPLWFIATKGGAATARLSVFKTNPKLVRQLFGVILIFTAAFIYFGFEKQFQIWLLNNLPENWVQIAPKIEEYFGVDEIIYQQ